MSEALEQNKMAGESAIEARGPARDAGDHEHHAHGPSYKLLALIFGVLLCLTWLTVYVTNFDLGYNGNLTLALVIAFVKAAFVGLWFMHLRYDPPIFGFTLLISLGFVTLFIVFTLLDTSEVLYRVNALAETTASQ